MKPTDVKSSSYIDFNEENNKEDPKSEVGDQVKTLKYKNIFAKGYTLNWSEKVFGIKKVQILFVGHMLLVILTLKKLFTFYKKNCKKQIKKSLGLKK